MPKPHIKRGKIGVDSWVWLCSSGGRHGGYGDTPAQAYQYWAKLKHVDDYKRAIMMRNHERAVEAERAASWQTYQI